jgi:hypothetical protein
VTRTVYYSAPTPGGFWWADETRATNEGPLLGHLGVLSGLWERQQAPPAEAYAALTDVVLPDGRPLEVFPYAPSLEAGGGNSAGHLLVHWAVRAGRADDLRRRLAARGKHPLAAVPSHLIELQLDVALKDAGRAAADLAWFAERLGRDQEGGTARDACQAGLAALPLAPVAADARRLVERAVAHLGSERDYRGIGRVRLALARHLLQAGPKEDGRELIRTGLRPETVDAPDDDPFPYRGRYVPQQGPGPSVRRLIEPVEAIPALVQAGEWDGAWEALGLWADEQAGQPTPVPADAPAGWLALLRRCSGLPAAERYAQLASWSLPGAGRTGVRIVAGAVPVERPPPVFKAAKVPGEDGVLSTAGLLVGAAKEAGKLDELAARLRPLVGTKTRNAAELLALAQAARAPAEDGPSVEALLPQTGRPAAYPFWPTVRRPVAWPTLLVVRACLAEPRLRASGERLARRLIEQADPNDGGAALLRRELAIREGGSPPALWRPGAAAGSAGFDPLWVARGAELRLEAGAGQGGLQFTYPLAGRFEFSVEAAFGDDVSGSVGYAGRLPWPNATDQQFDGPAYDDWGDPTAFGRRRLTGWQRLTVQAEPSVVRFLRNGTVFHEAKDPDPTNPFLTLAGPGQGRAVFRNAQLTGDPEIPREVSLLGGARLDGWVGAYYFKRVRVPPGTVRPFLAPGGLFGGEPEDWAAEDGVLSGRRVPAATSPTPSVLARSRPLQPGEAVSYEFFYQPGEVMVHPALGRLAFLLEPGGVRLHWLGGLPFDESLGLKADNAVVEPECRRGPGELPLKAGEWNQAELALDAGRLRVKLNGVLVYERPLEAAAGQAFGLFHYQDQTAARARKVVLKGDWPRKLSEAQRRNLLAPAGTSETDRP